MAAAARTAHNPDCHRPHSSTGAQGQGRVTQPASKGEVIIVISIFSLIASGITSAVGTAAVASRIIFPAALSLGGGAVWGAFSGLLGQALALSLTVPSDFVINRFSSLEGTSKIKVRTITYIACTILGFAASAALGALIIYGIGFPITLTGTLLLKLIALNVVCGLAMNTPLLVLVHKDAMRTALQNQRAREARATTAASRNRQ